MNDSDFAEEVESGQLDYKRSVETDRAKSWLKTVSAFANTQGGVILFGVDDKTREKVGLADIQGSISKISQLITARIHPSVQYEFNVVPVNVGITCLSLEIFRGITTPYYYTHEQTHVAYVRHGDRSEPANFIELNNLILRGQHLTFDELPSRYMVDDLSFTVLKATYKQRTGMAFNGERDMVSMHLTDENQNITNGGALLSDQGGLRQSKVVCTRWNGKQKGSVLKDASDDKEYTNASLIMLLENAETFVRNNSKTAWQIKGMQREEFSDYPYPAVRETLVNALIHRDYQNIGAEIHVDMFDDRMEISSPGGMLSGKQIQDCDLNNVPSVRRNEIIADVFARLHYMDRRGSGFGRIMAAYAEYDKKPHFYSDFTFFLVTLPNCNYKETVGMSGEKVIGSEEKVIGSKEKVTGSEEKVTGSERSVENILLRYKNSFRGKNIQILEDLMLQRNDTAVFTPKYLHTKYGLTEQSTYRFVAKCVELGLMRRIKRGVYSLSDPEGDAKDKS